MHPGVQEMASACHSGATGSVLDTVFPSGGADATVEQQLRRAVALYLLSQPRRSKPLANIGEHISKVNADLWRTVRNRGLRLKAVILHPDSRGIFAWSNSHETIRLDTAAVARAVGGGTAGSHMQHDRASGVEPNAGAPRAPAAASNSPLGGPSEIPSASAATTTSFNAAFAVSDSSTAKRNNPKIQRASAHSIRSHPLAPLTPSTVASLETGEEEAAAAGGLGAAAGALPAEASANGGGGGGGGDTDGVYSFQLDFACAPSLSERIHTLDTVVRELRAGAPELLSNLHAAALLAWPGHTPLSRLRRSAATALVLLDGEQHVCGMEWDIMKGLLYETHGSDVEALLRGSQAAACTAAGVGGGGSGSVSKADRDPLRWILPDGPARSGGGEGGGGKDHADDPDSSPLLRIVEVGGEARIQLVSLQRLMSLPHRTDAAEAGGGGGGAEYGSALVLAPPAAPANDGECGSGAGRAAARCTADGMTGTSGVDDRVKHATAWAVLHAAAAAAGGGDGGGRNGVDSTVAAAISAAWPGEVPLQKVKRCVATLLAQAGATHGSAASPNAPLCSMTAGVLGGQVSKMAKAAFYALPTAAGSRMKQLDESGQGGYLRFRVQGSGDEGRMTLLLPELLRDWRRGRLPSPSTSSAATAAPTKPAYASSTNTTSSSDQQLSSCPPGTVAPPAAPSLPQPHTLPGSTTSDIPPDTDCRSPAPLPPLGSIKSPFEARLLSLFPVRPPTVLDDSGSGQLDAALCQLARSMVRVMVGAAPVTSAATSAAPVTPEAAAAVVQQTRRQRQRRGTGGAGLLMSLGWLGRALRRGAPAVLMQRAASLRECVEAVCQLAPGVFQLQGGQPPTHIRLVDQQLVQLSEQQRAGTQQQQAAAEDHDSSTGDAAAAGAIAATPAEAASKTAAAGCSTGHDAGPQQPSPMAAPSVAGEASGSCAGQQAASACSADAVSAVAASAGKAAVDPAGPEVAGGCVCVTKKKKKKRCIEVHLTALFPVAQQQPNQQQHAADGSDTCAAAVAADGAGSAGDPDSSASSIQLGAFASNLARCMARSLAIATATATATAGMEPPHDFAAPLDSLVEQLARGLRLLRGGGAAAEGPGAAGGAASQDPDLEELREGVEAVCELFPKVFELQGGQPPTHIRLVDPALIRLAEQQRAGTQQQGPAEDRDTDDEASDVTPTAATAAITADSAQPSAAHAVAGPQPCLPATPQRASTGAEDSSLATVIEAAAVSLSGVSAPAATSVLAAHAAASAAVPASAAAVSLAPTAAATAPAAAAALPEAPPATGPLPAAPDTAASHGSAACGSITEPEHQAKAVQAPAVEPDEAIDIGTSSSVLSGGGTAAADTSSCGVVAPAPAGRARTRASDSCASLLESALRHRFPNLDPGPGSSDAFVAAAALDDPWMLSSAAHVSSVASVASSASSMADAAAASLTATAVAVQRCAAAVLAAAAPHYAMLLPELGSAVVQRQGGVRLEVSLRTALRMAPDVFEVLQGSEALAAVGSKQQPERKSAAAARLIHPQLLELAAAAAAAAASQRACSRGQQQPPSGLPEPQHQHTAPAPVTQAASTANLEQQEAVPRPRQQHQAWKEKQPLQELPPPPPPPPPPPAPQPQGHDADSKKPKSRSQRRAEAAAAAQQLLLKRAQQRLQRERDPWQPDPRPVHACPALQPGGAPYAGSMGETGALGLGAEEPLALPVTAAGKRKAGKVVSAAGVALGASATPSPQVSTAAPPPPPHAAALAQQQRRPQAFALPIPVPIPVSLTTSEPAAAQTAASVAQLGHQRNDSATASHGTGSTHGSATLQLHDGGQGALAAVPPPVGTSAAAAAPEAAVQHVSDPYSPEYVQLMQHCHACKEIGLAVHSCGTQPCILALYAPATGAAADTAVGGRRLRVESMKEVFAAAVYLVDCTASSAVYGGGIGGQAVVSALLSSLRGLLEEPGVVKVVHGCEQVRLLEVACGGACVAPLRDTAALCSALVAMLQPLPPPPLPVLAQLQPQPQQQAPPFPGAGLPGAASEPAPPTAGQSRASTSTASTQPRRGRKHKSAAASAAASTASTADDTTPSTPSSMSTITTPTTNAPALAAARCQLDAHVEALRAALQEVGLWPDRPALLTSLLGQHYLAHHVALQRAAGREGQWLVRPLPGSQVAVAAGAARHLPELWAAVAVEALPLVAAKCAERAMRRLREAPGEVGKE